MRLSVTFSGFGGLVETIPVVLAAEEYGLDGVWSAEHLGFHDAIVPSAAYLSKTSRLEIGLVGLSTGGRHPGLLAMELMSLSELAPGRIRCQVGLGDASLVAKLGHKASKPISSTTAFVNSLRETLQGRDMKGIYPEFTFDGFRMSPTAPTPPIDVMAVRPKMVQTSTRVGDGLSISVGASATYLRDVVADVERELAAAGRDRSSFRITAHALAAIGDDLDAVRAPIGSMIASVPQDTSAFLARGVVDPDEVLRVQQESGLLGLMKLWSPDKIDQIAFIATPAMLADRLAEYADTGIDELSLMMLNPASDQAGIVKQLALAHGR